MQKSQNSILTTPYSLEVIDQLDQYVPAYKIGSGITWLEIIEKVASLNKPYMLATGASSMDEVVNAVEKALAINPKIVLMQCNTNYTGSIDNFNYINLNVLKCYKQMYPNIVLGLSDHTPGHSTVLGAITLGARVIEKHFTDDTGREGPDHAFSMCPLAWKEMVDRSRELELALGLGVKKIECNEIETSVVQRRSIRTKRLLRKGENIKREDLEILRPCPKDALSPALIREILDKRLLNDIAEGEYLRLQDILLLTDGYKFRNHILQL